MRKESPAPHVAACTPCWPRIDPAPAHWLQRKRRPTSGTTIVSASASTSTSAACPPASHVAATALTPFWRTFEASSVVRNSFPSVGHVASSHPLIGASTIPHQCRAQVSASLRAPRQSSDNRAVACFAASISVRSPTGLEACSSLGAHPGMSRCVATGVRDWMRSRLGMAVACPDISKPRFVENSISSNCCSSRSRLQRPSGTRCSTQKQKCRPRRRCCWVSMALGRSSLRSSGPRDSPDTSITADRSPLMPALRRRLGKGSVNREQSISQSGNPRLTGWGLHPLESAAFARRTREAVVGDPAERAEAHVRRRFSSTMGVMPPSNHIKVRNATSLL